MIFEYVTIPSRGEMPKSIAGKLLIKEGFTVRMIDAPRGYLELLRPLPTHVTVLNKPVRPADVIQVFVANRRELQAQLPRLARALKPGGLLWVTYLKGTSPLKTDINRDSINAYAGTIGLKGVAMIAIDADWSALRLRPV